MKKYVSFGHFGKGTGAASNGRDEYLLAFGFVRSLVVYLQHNPLYIIKQDEKNLNEVVRYINADKDIGFAVEFHFNAGGGSGCEVVVSPKTSARNKSKAAALSQVISDALHIKNRGVKTSDKTPRKSLAFCDKIHCPSMIVELGFIDSDDDMNAFVNYYDNLVRAVGTFLADY